MATPFLLYGIFEWIYYKKKNINYDNLLISLCISIIVGIIAYLVPYLIIDKFISLSANYLNKNLMIDRFIIEMWGNNK